MTRARKTFSAICLAAVLLFMALLPKYVLPGKKSPGLLDWLEPGEEAFRGEVAVWHVVRFKPYKGSVSTVLKVAARIVEKRHFGVYLNVESMSEKEAGERIARGERPDILSFPPGFAASSALTPLDGPFGRFDSLGSVDGSLLAVPYAASCRLMFYYPARITADEALSKAGEGGSAAEFIAGRAAFCVSDARTAGELARLEAANRAEHFELEAVEDSTSLVQFIGVSASPENEAKRAVEEEFIRVLSGEKLSKMLADIGLFPLMANEFPILPDPALEKAYRRIIEGGGPAANAFSEP